MKLAGSLFLKSVKTATRSLGPRTFSPAGRYLSTAAYEPVATTAQFPSLIIGAKGKGVEPVGSFAQAQAVYLDPDPEAVQQLKDALIASNMGIVAHYYMDVELQGVLQAVKAELPDRVGIADSLRMGDMAVEMVSPEFSENPATGIACLGVDFMSESVQAILSKNDYAHIPVYRATSKHIGCSLAESAERESYRAWLQAEGDQANALHVIYINTSLETKAVSSSLVPTITCTSSNVLNTLLTASAQIPDLKILYGPDTYMGYNLVTLLDVLVKDWDDARIQKDLHPAHNRASIEKLRDSIHVFPQGNCVVHHMFGAKVVDTVREHYQDAFVTAHLEVPGEMFGIAMEKSLDDRGVVGSTSDILNFVSRKVAEAAEAKQDGRLQFILGTEAGMVTSIVKSVQEILEGHDGIEAEIVFPVASDAVTGTDDGLVPGVPATEGCSTAGGCATCPFMKMNDLDALLNVLETAATDPKALESHLPTDRLTGKMLNGIPATELGSEAILYMREFMKEKKIPEELVRKIQR